MVTGRPSGVRPPIREREQGLRKHFPSVRICGVRVEAIDVRRLHAYIAHSVKRRRTVPILHANAFGVTLARKDRRFAGMLEKSPLVFCDGSGVRIGAKMLGYDLPSRITYADWIHQLVPFLRDQGLSLFLLGSKPGVAETAARRLQEQYPGLVVAGTQDGYFAKAGPENDAVVARLNEARPDVVLVGFGMPLQERWIEDNLERLGPMVLLSCGAGIDYAAGEVRRGPQFLVDNHMEWLARLWVEPGRLWKRYLLGNPQFLAMVLWERLRKGRAGRRAVGA